MTEKQKVKVNNVIQKFPNEYNELFQEIVEYITSLGYIPKVNANETYADFIKNKHGRVIMKIECGYEKPPAIKIPRLNIRLDALPKCTGIFEEAVLHFKKTFCPKCGKCDGKYGLNYVLSNGGEIYTCRHTIHIPSFNTDTISEIKQALKIQDDYLLKNYSNR